MSFLNEGVSYESMRDTLLADPATSDWLRQAINDLADLDPEAADRDAELFVRMANPDGARVALFFTILDYPETSVWLRQEIMNLGTQETNDLVSDAMCLHRLMYKRLGPEAQAAKSDNFKRAFDGVEFTDTMS